MRLGAGATRPCAPEIDTRLVEQQKGRRWGGISARHGIDERFVRNQARWLPRTHRRDERRPDSLPASRRGASPQPPASVTSPRAIGCVTSVVLRARRLRGESSPSAPAPRPECMAIKPHASSTIAGAIALPCRSPAWSRSPAADHASYTPNSMTCLPSRFAASARSWRELDPLARRCR